MKGKYLRKIGGLALTALMLFGIAFVSSSEAQAQNRRRSDRSSLPLSHISSIWIWV